MNRIASAIAILILAACTLPPPPVPRPVPQRQYTWFPLHMGSGRLPPIGIEIVRRTPAQVRAVLEAAQVRGVWNRWPGPWWEDVEPVRGAGYVWSADTDGVLALFAEWELETILTIGQSPVWARAYPDSVCGPVAREHWMAFGRYAAAVVRKYAKPPYGVRHIEIWNEPDAGLATGGQRWGCWNHGDPYQAGRIYGQFVNAVVPFIRRANPHVKIIMGSFALGCGVTGQDGAACSLDSLLFIDGVLSTGAGNAVDIIGFHAYRFWKSGEIALDVDLFDLKEQRLLGLLKSHGINRPLAMTEGGLLCNNAQCNSLAHRRANATYIWLLAQRCQSMATGCVIYPLHYNSWYSSGVMAQGNRETPALLALRDIAERGYATPVPPPYPYPGVHQ